MSNDRVKSNTTGAKTPPSLTPLSRDLQTEGQNLMKGANREIFEKAEQELEAAVLKMQKIGKSFVNGAKALEERKQKITAAHDEWLRGAERRHQEWLKNADAYKKGVSDYDVRSFCKKEIPSEFPQGLVSQNPNYTTGKYLADADKAARKAKKIYTADGEMLVRGLMFEYPLLASIVVCWFVFSPVVIAHLFMAKKSQIPPVLSVIYFLVGIPVVLVTFLLAIYKIVVYRKKKKFYNLALKVHANVERVKELEYDEFYKSKREVENEIKEKLDELDAQLEPFEEERDEAIEKEKSRFCASFQDIQPIAFAQKHALQTYSQTTSYSGLPWTDAQWELWSPTSDQQRVVPEAALGRFESFSDFLLFKAMETEDDSSPIFDSPIVDPLLNSSSFDFFFEILKLPAVLSFSHPECLILEISSDTARKSANKAVQSLLLRLLAVTPPGKLRFTFIDPVELGHNVAAFMKLGDYEPLLINGRVWSDARHIEEKLAELSTHIENVIQRYLRTDYASIHEYNAKAGEIAEPFRFLVIFDFPSNFNENSFKKLVSIIRNGAKCGVYVIIVKDTAKELPYGCSYSEFTNCECFFGNKTVEFKGNGDLYQYWSLKLDEPPPDALAARIVREIGERAKAGMVVVVPFEKLLQRSNLETSNWWKASSATCLEVPLGPTGAQRLQTLRLGADDLAHHALVIGRPGSGKSNLMHVIIMSLALKYSPDEIQLYLIDSKEGVEFQPYATAKLPHALAIAVQTEQEFAFSVIERLNKEFTKRGEEFRRVGVEKLSEYRRVRPDAKMPRILLLIDEFQQLLSGENNLSRTCATILENIVRKGRAFGIHIFLGTQTLQNSGLSTAIVGLTGVRIALQCSDNDSRLILADDNPAARTLTRPGEAIYNDQAGVLEGNNLFQVARYENGNRDQWLGEIKKLAGGKAPDEQFIFEGQNTFFLNECSPLLALSRATAWPAARRSCDLFLGEPIAIESPVAATLRRESGANFLAITRDEPEGVGMMIAGVVSLLLSLPPGSIQISILNFATADEPTAEYATLLAELFPDQVRVRQKQKEVPKALDGIAAIVNDRTQDNAAPAKEMEVLVVLGLHRIRSLRDGAPSDDEFDAMQSWHTILKDGPDVGVHTIAWSDTWANAQAHLDGSLYSEFGLRAAGTMTGQDSMRFLDDDAAAKLDRKRCLFYDESQPGKLVKFRHYSLPPLEWLRELEKILSMRK